jgi:competence protein ComGC
LNQSLLIIILLLVIILPSHMTSQKHQSQIIDKCPNSITSVVETRDGYDYELELEEAVAERD